MDNYGLYIIYWYLIGCISFILGAKLEYGDVCVMDIISALLCGIFGPVITLLLIVIIINKYGNKKLF
jgi:hypothetical protein